MTNDEYETAIGKLVLLKQFLTVTHHEAADAMIEGLVDEYLERRNNNEL